MIPTDDNAEAVPARLFVAVMAIERIARDLWWHASLPPAHDASSARARTLLLDCFPEYDELAEVYLDCKRLLAKVDAGVDVAAIRCAGELVTRAETAALIAHVTALRTEMEESSRPDPQFLQRVREGHERVSLLARTIASTWDLTPKSRSADGRLLEWTTVDYDAYRAALGAVRRSLKMLKADTSLRVMMLVGLRDPDVAIRTTCRLIELVLNFNFEPELLRRISPRLSKVNE